MGGKKNKFLIKSIMPSRIDCFKSLQQCLRTLINLFWHSQETVKLKLEWKIKTETFYDMASGEFTVAEVR